MELLVKSPFSRQEEKNLPFKNRITDFIFTNNKGAVS